MASKEQERLLKQLEEAKRKNEKKKGGDVMNNIPREILFTEEPKPSKPEPKPESKPEPKPESKPEPKPEPKPSTSKPEPEKKPEPKPELPKTVTEMRGKKEMPAQRAQKAAEDLETYPDGYVAETLESVEAAYKELSRMRKRLQRVRNAERIALAAKNGKLGDAVHVFSFVDRDGEERLVRSMGEVIAQKAKDSLVRETWAWELEGELLELTDEQLLLFGLA